MRPNTSVCPPIIAGVRGRKLSDLLRAWRCQPRKRSAGLFWSLIVFAFAVDTALFLVAVRLSGLVDSAPTSPPSERHMLVPHARNAALWEPLRHWVIRLDSRPRIFESFCRDAVRAITGDEYFEDNEPVPVVVAWMLHGNPDTSKVGERNSTLGSPWDDYPFLHCEDPALRALLYRERYCSSQLSLEEQLHGVYVEPSVLRQSKRFHQMLRGIEAKSRSAARLSPLEKHAVELKDRLAFFDRIRTGGLDADGEAMATASAALRQLYQSGKPDLIEAGIRDFLSASQRTLLVNDEAARRRLVCEDWLNERHPFHQALVLNMLAVGLFAVVMRMGVRRRWWRRGLLVSGLLACVGCLGWSAAGFYCRAILHDGVPMSDGSEVILWVATLAMCLGLVLTLLYRDVVIAMTGALVSLVGFVLAHRWPPTFAANGLVADAWSNLPLLATVSAYAALALAWGVAILTLGRLALAAPIGERLCERAGLCARLIGIALALLAVAAVLGAFGVAEPGCCWRGWDGPALGAFLVLPGCAFLLYARRLGWLQPFGLLLGSVLGFTLIVIIWHILSRGSWDWRSAFDLKADAWLYGACLVNLSLMVHVALRYYFCKQIA